MKAAEVTTDLIGKRCKCIFTGLMVTGTIEEIKITEYTAEVKVSYDKRHRWGNDVYKEGWSFARLHDDFGTLQHLEIIDNNYQTIVAQFKSDITEIDRMFAQEYSKWGAVNLKEWIDNYESSRFTQFSSDTAIITSEYNMDKLLEWLNKRGLIAEFQYIIK